MEFTCQEDTSLPPMTLSASSRTALVLRSHLGFARFALQFDDSLPDDLLLVSSDLHAELQEFLLIRDQSGPESDGGPATQIAACPHIRVNHETAETGLTYITGV